MEDLDPFLRSDDIIDWETSAVLAKAKALAHGLASDKEIAQKCFEFVRDEIDHSGDIKADITTCSASEVLEYKTGWCFAKSHLLAALLRANGIPTALVYQRLSFNDDGKPPYSLHGLNSLYLQEFGWYRVDPRGNKEGIDAQFEPPLEKLAFNPVLEGEMDMPQRHSTALPQVVEVLRNYHSCQSVLDNLPDI